MIDCIIQWVRHHVPFLANESERMRWRREMKEQAHASERALLRMQALPPVRRGPIDDAMFPVARRKEDRS